MPKDFETSPEGEILASDSNMPNRAPSASKLEIVIGRSLAACVHPVAAWRHRSKIVRYQIVAGYVLASYILGLLIVLLLGPAPTF